MRFFLLLTALTLLPFHIFAADDIDTQINKACLQHAVSLVARLKSEVVGELSDKKSEQALKLATDSCQAYFKKEFGQNANTMANTANDEKAGKSDGGVKDWLTESILNGDSLRKPGNERLKRIK